jgi:four helix bundle protein
MYDLEDRTLKLAVAVRNYAYLLPKTIANIEDTKQLIRSSGSIGANYLEANGALGKKDFLMRIRISRKEAKETIYWLKIILITNNLCPDIKSKGEYLIKETEEIRNILSSILKKSV